MYFGGISPTLPGSMEPPQAQVTAASSFPVSASSHASCAAKSCVTNTVLMLGIGEVPRQIVLSLVVRHGWRRTLNVLFSEWHGESVQIFPSFRDSLALLCLHSFFTN